MSDSNRSHDTLVALGLATSMVLLILVSAVVGALLYDKYSDKPGPAPNPPRPVPAPVDKDWTRATGSALRFLPTNFPDGFNRRFEDWVWENNRYGEYRYIKYADTGAAPIGEAVKDAKPVIGKEAK